MNQLDKDYCNLLQDILDNGYTKKDRTGTGTKSVFGRQIRHKMSDGFPLLTTKKMYMKGIVTELLWFLRGDTNIKYLIDNDVHIWDGDAYKNYLKGWEHDKNIQKQNSTEEQYNEYIKEIQILSQEEFVNRIKTDDEFAKTWGDLGPIYGKQWRKWSIPEEAGGGYIDQIDALIENLKTNPDSRRLMVNAWNVAEIEDMVLPPCHYGFQCYTRELNLEEKVDWLNKNYPMYDLGNWTIERLSDSDYLKDVEFEYNIPTRAISLKWDQRSVDTFLGLPFNIASYGLLLEIIAKTVNMVPDELIGNLGDTHIYLNHIEQAKEQIGREMTTEERNNWHLVNRCGGNIRDCKTDWKDFELDQQNVPKRTREPFPLPTLNKFGLNFEHGLELFNEDKWNLDQFINGLYGSDFILNNYQSHPAIKADLSN
jgi:thymidylate synthase